MKIPFSKTYIAFGLILSVMALFVALSMMKIFESMRIANEIDSNLLESVAPRLTITKLNEAIQKTEEKEIVLLD